MPKGFKGFQKGNNFGFGSQKRRKSFKGKNNPNYGKHHTKEVKEKLRKLHLNEGSPRWKGDKAKPRSIHSWVEKRLPKPTLCSRCGLKKVLELSNNNHTYKRNLSDWEWICRKCHMWKDGRQFNLKQYGKQTKTIYRKMEQ